MSISHASLLCTALSVTHNAALSLLEKVLHIPQAILKLPKAQESPWRVSDMDSGRDEWWRECPPPALLALIHKEDLGCAAALS